MELTILNTNFQAIGVIDTFTSLIWKDAYRGYGDFELIASPTDTDILSQVNSGPYLTFSGSEHVMVIEDLHIRSEVSSNKVTVKGRSLETILSRRVIWYPVTLTGNFQDGIKKLLDDNAIAPVDADRKITRLTFEASTDPIITALTIDQSYLGENLYSVITSLCLSKNIGYKLTLNASGNFVFKLYSGVDRSYGQTNNPFVVFSPEFDNLLNSDYTASDTNSKTVALTLWEGQGDLGPETVRMVVNSPNGAATELSRREIYVDGSSISKGEPTGVFSDTEYSAAMTAKVVAYLAQLKQLGELTLADNVIVESFEGEIDTNPLGTYIYNRDFFMGDIVQIEDEYGHQSKSQVTYVIHSQDGNSEKLYPTFSAVP